jgi:2-isopropylmalate synthase
MRAEDVGWAKNSLVLGKHSGRRAFRVRMDALGISYTSQSLFDEAFARFKQLADKKHEIFDDDLQAIASDVDLQSSNEYCNLVSMQTNTTAEGVSTVKITLNINDEILSDEASGPGVIDAAFTAIKKITGSNAHLKLYSVNAITGGTDAQGEVTTRLESEGRIVNGQGADIDIVVASVKSYINALNRLGSQVSTHPQMTGV